MSKSVVAISAVSVAPVVSLMVSLVVSPEPSGCSASSGGWAAVGFSDTSLLSFWKVRHVVRRFLRVLASGERGVRSGHQAKIAKIAAPKPRSSRLTSAMMNSTKTARPRSS